MGSDLPPLAIFIAPENYRYHAVSKVIGSQTQWLSLFGGQPVCGSRRGRPSNHSTSELSIVRDGIAAKSDHVVLSQPQPGLTIPSLTAKWIC
jgi:hypothetical protein